MNNKPTPTELGDVEAAELYATSLEVDRLDTIAERIQDHLAGQQHGALAERERIWSDYQQRERQGFNAPLDLKIIIFGDKAE